MVVKENELRDAASWRCQYVRICISKLIPFQFLLLQTSKHCFCIKFYNFNNTFNYYCQSTESNVPVMHNLNACLWEWWSFCVMKCYSYLACLLNICQLTDCRDALPVYIPNKSVCFVSVGHDPKYALLYSVSLPPTSTSTDKWLNVSMCSFIIKPEWANCFTTYNELKHLQHFKKSLSLKSNCLSIYIYWLVDFKRFKLTSSSRSNSDSRERQIGHCSLPHGISWILKIRHGLRQWLWQKYKKSPHEYKCTTFLAVNQCRGQRKAMGHSKWHHSCHQSTSEAD